MTDDLNSHTLLIIFIPTNNTQEIRSGFGQIPNIKTKTFEANSFVSRGAHLWNTQPDATKSVNSTEIFKKKLNKRMGENAN